MGFLGVVALAAVVAIGAASVISWGFRPADVWVMPGALGRVRDDGSLAPRQSGTRGFLSRAIGLGGGDEAEWGRRNGITPALSFSHHMSAVFPPELAKTHPDFFPLIDGKRLQPVPRHDYWNPDMGRQDTADFAAERAVDYFRAHPADETYSLGINDGYVFGDSPETLALVTPQRWFRDRPDYSRLVFTFMNRAAAAFARTMPDKYLGCLAYYWCENAPPFPIDRHVIPFLTSDRTQGYDPAFRAQEFRLQEAWARAMGVRRPDAPNSAATPHGLRPRLGMYDYLDGYGFLVPRVPIHALAEQIRHAYDVGFTDYYGESSRNWGLDGPMPWVIARLLRDPHENVDRLLDFYYRTYFGSAAEPMRRYFDGCERQWMAQSGPSYWLKHYRNESQAILFPSAVCRELRSYLDDASARANSDLVRRRVAFVADSFGVTERFVALQERRAELTTTLLRSEAPPSRLASLLERYAAARSEFIRDTVRTTARWPLAFSPIGFEDFVGDDPGFAAAMRLASDGVRIPPYADPSSAGVRDGLASAAALKAGGMSEILVDGAMRGPLQPGLRIAGLMYAPDLPAPWRARNQPTRTSQMILRRESQPGENAANSAPVLRFSGAEGATVYQWVRAKPGALYLASVEMRGLVSSGDAVTLAVGWLDEKERRIGKVVSMRLPDGSWPEWVDLCQGARAPTDAAWVGITMTVMHQVGADWAEGRRFSLREAR